MIEDIIVSLKSNTISYVLMCGRNEKLEIHISSVEVQVQSFYLIAFTPWNISLLFASVIILLYSFTAQMFKSGFNVEVSKNFLFYALN